MGSAERSQTTELLLQIRSLGDADSDARERLFTTVYDELRRVATALMRRERAGHTLRPTALVHEAYLRLVRQENVTWENRAHFLGIAARAMRQILVDHAREKSARKRGGDLTRITLDEGLAAENDRVHEIIDLDTALDKLAAESERVARVVEFKVFGGLGMSSWRSCWAFRSERPRGIVRADER